MDGPAFDHTLETNHECPKCGYSWQGDCKGGDTLSGQTSLLDALSAPDALTQDPIQPESSHSLHSPAQPGQGQSVYMDPDPPSGDDSSVADLPTHEADSQETAPTTPEGVESAPDTTPADSATERSTPATPPLTVGVGRSSWGSSQDPSKYGTGSLDDPAPTVIADGGRERQGIVATPAAARPQQIGLDIVDDKPPYRIPSMREIRETEPNGLTVISTFSGCGGSCLGFKWAGFNALWASEFVPAAADTYRANFPDVPLGIQDIREVEPEMLLARFGLERGELDVLEGSPPCASFSTAGKRAKLWGEEKQYSDVKQRTDDLLMEYVRILRGLMPRSFVMENVPGLVRGVARGYFKEVFSALEESGYRVAAKILDAQWLGVPQRRQRVIFVGFRTDLEVRPLYVAYPDRLPYRYSIKDALPHLAGGVRTKTGPAFGGGRMIEPDEPMHVIRPGDSRGGSQAWQLDVYDNEPPAEARIVVDRRTSSMHPGQDELEYSLDEPMLSVTASGISGDVHSDWMLHLPTQEELDETSIERFAIGEEWEKLEPGESSDKYMNLVKPDAEQPSPTVTQMGGIVGAASVTHPTEARKFTINELRRLCGFPDDFELTGTYRQQWERLGRAVPPPMMRAVAERVATALLE